MALSKQQSLSQYGTEAYTGWGETEARADANAKGIGTISPTSSVQQPATSSAPLPTAPAGGFQQGGWYNGRQYWNGTFSEPGQIHPESNQQGAGQMVSPEVNAQTSIAAGLAPGANEAYINSQYSQPGAAVPGTYAATQGALKDGTSATTTGGSVTETQKQMDSLQATIQNKKSEADKRRAEVNDNPFLSEASRVGRIRRIDEMLNDSLQTDQEQLGYLQKLKEQEDLAAERSAERAAEAAKPDYQIISETDNNGNLTIITIDKKTGQIVSQVSGGKVGKAATGGGGDISNTSLISTYVPRATSILEEIDASTLSFSEKTQKEMAGEKGGDQLLSKDEALAAYGKVLTLSGNNPELAQKIFDTAWDLGGYQKWNW